MDVFILYLLQQIYINNKNKNFLQYVVGKTKKRRKSRSRSKSKSKKRSKTLDIAKRSSLIVDTVDFRKALFTFKLLRVRMKISYSAFMRQKTVKQLFLQTILETYFLHRAQYDPDFRPFDIKSLLEQCNYFYALNFILRPPFEMLMQTKAQELGQRHIPTHIQCMIRYHQEYDQMFRYNICESYRKLSKCIFLMMMNQIGVINLQKVQQLMLVVERE